MTEFDAVAELEKLKVQTKLIRKKNYSRSRLDKFRGELLLLKKNGASAAELQRWLRAKRIKVELSTVTRWLARNA